MIVAWDEEAWSDYIYWQGQDKKTLKRINELIKDIQRNGTQGLGKAESLKYVFGGWYNLLIPISKMRSIVAKWARCFFFCMQRNIRE